jgi:hypothetical protein
MSAVAIETAPRPALDHEALLAALVLAPATYSRNRFFDMYRDQEVRRVRRRAIQLRSVIEHLVRPNIFSRQDPPSANGLVRLFYEVPAVGLRRTIALAPLELSLLHFAVARARNGGVSLPADHPDRRRIESALSRLAPVSVDAPLVPLPAPPV